MTDIEKQARKICNATFRHLKDFEYESDDVALVAARLALESCDSDLSRLRSENEALREQLRWRTEKPEKDGMYLTYFQNRFIKRQAYRVGYGWDTDTVYIPVIFWLPIPPLPEEAP